MLGNFIYLWIFLIKCLYILSNFILINYCWRLDINDIDDIDNVDVDDIDNVDVGDIDHVVLMIVIILTSMILLNMCWWLWSCWRWW